MKATTVGNILTGIAVVVAIASAFAGIYATYDTSSREQPQKRLAERYLSDQNPLSDLSSPNADVSINIKIGKENINSLRIVQTSLINVGKLPIVPNDIVEPISIESDPSWRIVSVVNSSPDGSSSSLQGRLQRDNDGPVQLEWSKVNDHIFTAKPALLNSGDNVTITAYLTKTDTAFSKDDLVGSVPVDVPIVWKTRIAGLKGIDEYHDESEHIEPFPCCISMQYEGMTAISFSISVPILFVFSFFAILRVTTSKIAIGIYLSIMIFITLGAADAISFIFFGRPHILVGGRYIFLENIYSSGRATFIWLYAASIAVTLSSPRLKKWLLAVKDIAFQTSSLNDP